MMDLSIVAPNYKRARDRWPEAQLLARYEQALSQCASTHTHGLIEHVKSFLESVSRLLITEFGIILESNNLTTTQLLTEALKAVGVENQRGASKFDKVLSGFNTLTDALTTARNDIGEVAHGKDGFIDALAVDHARSFLFLGDLVLSILLNALDGKHPNIRFTREPYERFEVLNARIDQSIRVDVSIDEYSDAPVIICSLATMDDNQFELRIEPSRLLFGTDREMYIEVLNQTSRAQPIDKHFTASIETKSKNNLVLLQSEQDAG